MVDLISIYPNPSNGKVYIEAKSEINKIKDVTFYDLLGEQVKYIVNNKSSQGPYYIDLSDLPSGAYFLKASTDKQFTIQKIILSK